MKNKKNIIRIIMLLIILIGVIVVAVKGFNVGLSLRPHHTFYYVFDKEYSKSDLEKVCDEVFKNKDYRIRGVEVFNDAVYIETSTITEEEENALAEKVSALDVEKAEGEEVAYDIYKDSNIKLTDEVKPYITPVLISGVIILIYTAIRFKKLNKGKVFVTLFNLVIEAAVLALLILSVIAIVRIPLEKITFSALILVEIIYLVIKFIRMENKLKEV